MKMIYNQAVMETTVLKYFLIVIILLIVVGIVPIIVLTPRIRHSIFSSSNPDRLLVWIAVILAIIFIAAVIILIVLSLFRPF